MIVDDAEYTSVVSIIRVNNSVAAIIGVMFFLDVEIIDIGNVVEWRSLKL